MPATIIRGAIALALAGLAFAAAPARAPEAAFKCGAHAYSDRPCTGGRQVGPHSARTSDKWKAPPQDRAVIARRATLSPQDRHECGALDVRLREQQAELKAKGQAATLQDEMPLVRTKKKFRELKC